MKTVNVTYLGHACFILEYEGCRIVLDPYSDGSVPGLGNIRTEANAVYCSHAHGDHNFTAGVKLIGGELPFEVTELETDHDDKGGTLRGANTVRIFDFDGLRVAHMGDIGRELTMNEAAVLNGVDCVLIPVGGFFTIDAGQAKAMAEIIGAKVVIPMHYRKGNIGYDVIGTLDGFTSLYSDVKYADGSFALTENTPAQVVVLNV